MQSVSHSMPCCQGTNGGTGFYISGNFVDTKVQTTKIDRKGTPQCRIDGGCLRRINIIENSHNSFALRRCRFHNDHVHVVCGSFLQGKKQQLDDEYHEYHKYLSQDTSVVTTRRLFWNVPRFQCVCIFEVFEQK